MINAILNKHLPRAFDNQLQDAVKSFEGSRKGTGGTYDPITDTYVGNTDVTYSGRGVFSDYKVDETKDTQINLSDIKLTALAIEVTANPQVDDVIVQDDKGYRVLNVGSDPTGSVWTLQLRGIDDAAN